MAETSQQLSESLRHRLGRAALNRWKLETASKAIGVQGLHRAQEMSLRNQEAENRAIRQKLWGNDGQPDCEEDIGHMYLGDVTHTHQYPQPSQPKSSLGPLLAAGLGMLGPLGGVTGYFVNQAMQATPTRPAAVVAEPQPAFASPFSSTINTREELGVRILSEDELLP